MDWKTLVTGLASGAVVTPLLYWLYPRLKITDGDRKQWYTIIVAFFLGLVGLLLSYLSGFTVMPLTLSGWGDALIPVGAMAYTTSQVIFAAYEGRKAAKRAKEAAVVKRK